LSGAGPPKLQGKANLASPSRKNAPHERMEGALYNNTSLFTLKCFSVFALRGQLRKEGD